jgi:hypothetical protein
MIKDIHPPDTFKDENPSISYIWKWLKSMLYDYMNLKVTFFLIFQLFLILNINLLESINLNKKSRYGIFINLVRSFLELRKRTYFG